MTQGRRPHHGLLCRLACAALLLCVAAASSSADETRRRIEEETRRALEPTEAVASAAASKPIIDYGGWSQFRYINYHDDDKDASTTDTVDDVMWVDTRLWMKAVFRPDAATDRYRYSLYLRLKNLYSESQPKATAGGSDNDGPHVDYAYAHVDLEPWRVRAGRQYFSVGQGLAYSDVDDGATLFYSAAPWELKAFWSRTEPHEDNIDTSVPGFEKGGERHFYGLQADYTGWTGHNLYAFGVWQRDDSDERPADAAQNYDYDSEYVGVGVRGKWKENRISYWWESVHETGESVITGTTTKSDVSAWAHVVAVSYEPEMTTHPSLYVKGAYGSGDADRTSVTDTVNGNASGKDRNFLYFGYLPTGYAFAPRLSNMYFFKTGVSCTPFEKCAWLEKIDVAVDYYRYFKADAAGGIYDTQATQASADVGAEVDVTVNWRIFSDLYLCLQYGHFMPGDAFPDATDDSEDYLSVSLSLSF